MSEEVVTSAAAAESAADQIVELESTPKASEIASDFPRGLAFGALVRFHRKKRGLTQLRLSETLGHSTPEWAGQIEAGTRKINLDEIPQLAGVLQLSALNLGKVAVRDQLPKLAAALFGDQSGDGEVPESTIGPGTNLLPASAEFARAWQKLKPAHRQIISATVEALQEDSSSDRRGRIEKTRPQPKARNHAIGGGEA